MKHVHKPGMLISVFAWAVLSMAACSPGAPQETPGTSPISTSQPFITTSAPEMESQPEAGDPEQAGAPYLGCPEANPHPIGENIASTYQVAYEQVIDWYCSGNSFEDILVALETSAATDISAGALLEMRQQDQSWDEIWASIDYIQPPLPE